MRCKPSGHLATRRLVDFASASVPGFLPQTSKSDISALVLEGIPSAATHLFAYLLAK